MSKRENTSRPSQSEKVRKTLRGRAEKACVRCRAKKRTCDGGNPCMRCKESHGACYYSDWHYAVPYPREYVEHLEEQQEQLSIALLTMRRLLKEANVQTMPALPETEQAQDLLVPLREAKVDHRQTQALHQQFSASFGNNTMAYNNEGDATPPDQFQLGSTLIGSASASPIQPSVFPPLSTRSLKPPYLPPRCSSFPLPERQPALLTMPLPPRMANDPCTSGSSSGGGASPAIGDVHMSMFGAQWSYPARSFPTSAPYSMTQGYHTPLTPSSDILTNPGDHEGAPNYAWMFGSEFGVPGIDSNNGQPGDLDPDWNDVNRVPWGRP